MSPRSLPLLVLLTALGCSASPPATVAPVTAEAGPTDAVPVVMAEPGDPAPSATSAARTAAPASAAAPTSPTPTASASASPLASTSAAAAPPTPTSPITPEDRKVIAMCTGQASIFTHKELELLDLADRSPNQDLHDQAAAIRERRKESLAIACDRLRREGKL